MITLGKFTATQGKNGELRLRLADDRLRDALTTSKVYVGKAGRTKEVKIESIVSRNDFFVVKLEGVEDLNQAGEFKGLDVMIPDEGLRLLGEDLYYGHQLMGCTVLTKDGRKIGVVTDLLEAGPSNLLVVDRNGGEVLIPFHKEICLEIDTDRKEIVIDPPDGLLELNEI